jgi:hypothetical protein
MSKNTGTSELINYFDLGASGAVGIGGNLTLSTIANATTDTDKFLVSDTGIIKYRTGTQLLSDIGGQVAGNYVTTDTSQAITANKSFTVGFSLGSEGSGNQTSFFRNTSSLFSGSGGTNIFGFNSSNNIYFGKGLNNGGVLQWNNTTATRYYTLPDADGTLALTSAIPANIVTGTGAQGRVAYWDSTGVIKSDSLFQWNDFSKRLGIGRTPTVSLDVEGAGFFSTSVTAQQSNITADGAGVVLQGYVDNNLRIAVRGSGYNSGSRGGLLASTGDFSGALNGTSASFKVSADRNLATKFDSQITLSAQSDTGAPESLRIYADTFRVFTATTAVGLTERLSISNTGAATFSSSVNVGGTSANTDFRVYRTVDTGAYFSISAPGGSPLTSILGISGTNVMSLNQSGNVGIGTTNPNAQLSGTYGLSIVNSSNAAIGLSNGSNHWLNYLSGTTYRIWNNSVAEVMTLTYGGNVLIGTTTDSGYKLFVNGASYLDGYNYASSIQYTRAVSNTVNPAGGNGVLIFSGGQTAMRMDSAYTMNFDMFNGGSQFTALQIRQNGNAVSVNSPNNQLCLEIAYQGVGQGYLGATASFGRALLAYSQNGGYVYLSSSSTWVAASDRNRKKNFEVYNKGLAEICNLKPTLFNLKNQSDDEPKIAGLIAQEVGEHLKEAFSDGEFIGIDYSVLTVTIINAIKELNEKINKLS